MPQATTVIAFIFFFLTFGWMAIPILLILLVVFLIAGFLGGDE